MQIPLKAQLGKGIFLVAAPNLRESQFQTDGRVTL
jgi:hypothetical protein